MKVEIKEKSKDVPRFPALYRSTREEDEGTVYIVGKTLIGRDLMVVVLNGDIVDFDGSWKTEEELMRDFERLPVGTQVVLTQEI